MLEHQDTFKMALFYRIYNNQLFSAGDTPFLGFNTNEPLYIPDEYLENGEFVVMRTCHGIGDWCIISGIPRLLKEKYPERQIDIEFNDNTKEYTLQLTNKKFSHDPEIPVDLQIKVIYGDSVLGDTPLLLLDTDTNLVCIKTIQNSLISVKCG